jgi:hypothetical protein
MYLSPGLGISWDLDGCFVFSPKISLGIIDNGLFYNVTVGRSTSSNNKLYPHYFAEAQCGQLTQPSEFRKLQVFYGGGVGLTFPTSGGDSRVSFRTSIFTGYIFFLNATFIFREKIQTEIGGQIVAPVPIGGLDFGSIGG